jgi:hypothetical protein
MKQVQVHQLLLGHQDFSDQINLDFSLVVLLGLDLAAVDQVSGNLDIPRTAPVLAHSGLVGVVLAALRTGRLCFHL